MREASIATFALALGFLVLIFGGSPSAVTGYFSNLLLMTGYVLIYLAICRFTGTPFNQLLVYGFLPIGILTLTISAIVNQPWLPLIYIALFVDFVFNLGSVLVLYHSDYGRFKLSAYLTAIPLFI